MSPNDVFGGIAASALTVLPWIGVAVASAMGLALALLGIRKGLNFFFAMVEAGDGRGFGRRGGGSVSFGAADRARIDAFGEEGLHEMMAGRGFGYTDSERELWFNAYIERRVEGESHKGAVNDAHIAVSMR